MTAFYVDGNYIETGEMTISQFCNKHNIPAIGVETLPALPRPVTFPIKKAPR